MKTIKSLVLVAVFAFSTVVSATNPIERERDAKPSSIEQTISSLLEKPNFAIDQEITTTVSLIVNDNNEIVVLDVNSEDKQVESYVKLRLNYKKLDFNFEHKNKPLLMPLKLLSK